MAIIASLASVEARAQYGAGSSAMSTAGMGFYGNPYMNPYVNPFMNPYATQMQTTPGNAALFFFGAQAASGGIGSGQLSGSRGAGRTAAPRQPSGRSAEDRQPNAGVPSSVSRYFQRGPEKARAGSFYNRQGRYYPVTRR